MCLPGQSQHLTQRSTCEGCLVGKYTDQPGASGCLQCGVGTFQKETGKTFCLPCNPGTFNSKNQSTSCRNCPKGWMQKDVQGTSCTIAPAGSIVGKGGASSIEVAKGWHTTECDTNGICANSAPCPPGTIGTCFQQNKKHNVAVIVFRLPIIFLLFVDFL